jgi:Flp pilus assembly protein TadB
MRARKFTAVLALPFALTALLGAGSAFGAPPPAAPDGQIQDVKSAQGVLQYTFSVGNLPAGAKLDPKSIVVTAGGKTLDATAALADAAIDPGATAVREAILVLDVSGSMKGDGITGARAAALAYAASLPKDVRVGLITFNDKTKTLLTPTTDRTALKRAVGQVSAGGGTALYDGVAAAADALRGLPAGADRRLLILSDGVDTGSTDKLTDVTAVLRGYGIPADVVAFRLPGNQTALKTIASASGGRVLPANNVSDLGNAFNTAARAFRQQVLVTVKVPGSLSHKEVTLKTVLNAGAESVSATKLLTLPAAGSSNGIGSDLSITPAHGSVSNVRLWIILGACFVGLLAAAMVGLFLPVLNAERNRKNARLADVNRYRMVGAVGVPVQLVAAPTPGQESSAFTRRTLELVDKTVRARGQRERLVSELDRAGIRVRPEEWAVLQVCAVIIMAAVIAVLAGSLWGLPFGGLIGYLACRYFIQFKTGRRIRAFEEQLPDTLQLVAGSLRSGFSMSQALGGVVREGTEPTAGEFARALTEVRIGAELEDALDNVAERMRCDDLFLVVMAMRIAREVGGNLAEVLQNTVVTMRDRAQLRGTVRVLSAEGRISAKVLIALPFLLGGFLLLFKPGYLTPLVTTVPGGVLLAIGASLLALGSFWLSRLVKIEV